MVEVNGLGNDDGPHERSNHRLVSAPTVQYMQHTHRLQWYWQLLQDQDGPCGGKPQPTHSNLKEREQHREGEVWHHHLSPSWCSTETVYGLLLLYWDSRRKEEPKHQETVIRGK